LTYINIYLVYLIIFNLLSLNSLILTKMKNRLFTLLSLFLAGCFLSAQGPASWNQKTAYTHPALVINGTTTYISLEDVPPNTAITNSAYWATLDALVPTDTPSGLDSLIAPDASEVENLTVPDGDTENNDDNDYGDDSSITWDWNKVYTHPSMVINGANTHVTKKDVPVCTNIGNEEYWAKLEDTCEPVSVFNYKFMDLKIWKHESGAKIKWDSVIFNGDDSTHHSRYSLILKHGEDYLFYGGHGTGSALVHFERFNLEGNETLVAEFWDYDHNGQFVKGHGPLNIDLGNLNSLTIPNYGNSPDFTPPGPPANDYQETIAGLEEQIEQLMADLNAANEEISLKDETIAGLQSTNQELADENEDLRGELAEEVEKNDVLTAQVANLTQENNTLSYDLGVKTQQLEQAVEMAQVPFINGWVYDDIRGWMFTDADHYPMIYTHKDDTWHYFELGSSDPRYFFNFKSQQWEAWDPTE